MSKTKICPHSEPQSLVAEVQLRLADVRELPRVQSLLRRHHYLGVWRPVGERLVYIAADKQGQWVGVLIFCAATKYLRPRDQWIGWTQAQRRRRLALVVNNARFLLLPYRTVPNLGSRVLKLALARLSADWQPQYGHPVLAVESLVDPEQFWGTVYTANGWQELGLKDGWGRHGRDYYVKHGQPKRLFVKELCKNARRSLQAQHLKPALAMVEDPVAPRCTQRGEQLRPLKEHFQQVPEYRARVESYPLWSLLALAVCALVSGARRGPKALAAFAKILPQPHRRALGIRPWANGWYPAPSQPTFSRALQAVNFAAVERAVLVFQAQVRGQPPKEELIAMDGKEPKHGGGHSIPTAVAVPSQYYLGSALVDEKTNEIPVVRQRFQKLDLEGRYVSLDALHTQTETGLDLVLEHGAHYTLTVKDNQPGIHDTIKELLPEIPAAFPPEDSTRTRACTQERNRSRDEIRLLCTAPTTPEAVCFPAAAQVARVRRQTTDRQSETVALLTSAPPEELDAQTWLRLNRTGCSGIENGLHQRLDVSLDDDRCRVRNPNAMLVLGLFRRLGNSLFIEWRSHQTKHHYLIWVAD